MDQRIAMHAFERGRHARRRLAIGTEKRGTFHDQEGAQPLAAVQHAMPHGRHQALRPGDLAGKRARVEQQPEFGLDRRRAHQKCGFKGYLLVFRHGRER